MVHNRECESGEHGPWLSIRLLLVEQSEPRNPSREASTGWRVFLSLAVSPSFRAWVHHGVTAKKFSRRVVANQLPICSSDWTIQVTRQSDIFSQPDPHIVYPSSQVASPSITSQGWSRVLLGTNRMCGTMVTEWQQRPQNYNPLVSQPNFSTSYQYGTGLTVQPQRCLSLTRLAGRIRVVD
ncbi:hypothetical protein BO79DRAFT_224813 [Aspergillus costaricaensis CBS 115574]|uniref:Uncharacterized protein n=1 Tax=Aspergillus costaricaensis CBS 115574 TaxID=1448317 RepID=A0ACD1ISQ8_9EURO|nr:hypothetical protein BO79DRAFT_224813 [Aspergillus costaricaensis CBS 115574]RAK93318.1 hypothetical protein BO79DRAFT_224813 [Aspergillus costaricaensis CBS 115574]